MFRIRDLSIDFESIMRDSGVKKGDVVLDYGCGPGSYSIAASKAVGKRGMVIAADLQPLAVKRVEKTAASRGLKNIKAVKTDCDTGLESNSVDVVLLFDIYHALGDPEKILEEMRRILKPAGTMALADHHFTDEEIPSMIEGPGAFVFKDRSGKIFRFKPVSAD